MKELRDREQLLSATITLEDAEPLFLEFSDGRRGISSDTQVRNHGGARTFVVGDPRRKSNSFLQGAGR